MPDFSDRMGAVSYAVSLRADVRLADDAQLLLRLGTDANVDQTIKASLGHYLSYASVLDELGLPGAGVLTLSVYLLEVGHDPVDFRAAPFQRYYRTTSVGRARAADVPIWATDVAVEGRPLAMSAHHFDLVVSTTVDVLPDVYAAADRAERRRLRDLLRPGFEHVLEVFDSPVAFDRPPGSAGSLELGGA